MPEFVFLTDGRVTVLRKQGLIVLLVGVNLLLLAGLIIVSVPMPSASAQLSGGRPGDFLTVTAQPLGQSFDVIYMLDVPRQKLHAFVPINTQTKHLQPAPSFVDLNKELRGGK